MKQLKENTMIDMNSNTISTTSLPFTRNGITCDRLYREDFEEAVRVISQAFIDKEPMIQHIGTTPEEMYQLCKVFMEQAIDDDVSLIVKNQNGEIIGGTLCRDVKTEIDFSALPERFGPLFDMLEELVEAGIPQSEFEKMERGEGIEIFTTGISFNKSEKGVGRWLIECASTYFAEKGYKFSFSESVSPITQSLRTQCGFKALSSVDYEEFDRDGENPFSGITFADYPTSVKLFPEGRAGVVMMCKTFN